MFPIQLLGVIQQLRGQNFAIFGPPPQPPTLRGQFLYPVRGQKQTFFDPLHPHLVHVVIEWPLTWLCVFGFFESNGFPKVDQEWQH